MKKKFLAALTICLGMMGNSVFAMEKTDVDLFFCGRDTKLDNAIYIENNEYYIPLRECAEQIGGKVEYVPNTMIIVEPNAYSYSIKYNLNDNNIKDMKNKNGIPYVDGEKIKNINGMSYVEAKEFYELFAGYDVIVIEENNKVTLRVTENTRVLGTQQYKKSDFSNSLSLWNGIEKNQKNQNGAISPISLKLALAMVANGTTGQTQQQILNTLGYNTIEELNQFASNEVLKWTVQERKYDYENNFKKMENDGSIYFANSLWYNGEEKQIFNETFQNRVQSNLNGVVNTVTKDTAVQVINEWGKQATNGMLPELIQSADFETALINTTYFKCAWKNQFFEEDNTKGIFYNIDNTQSETDFMNQCNYAFYCESKGWQMLGLPYCDENYCMYLFLPEKGNQQDIDNDTINKLLQFQEQMKVKITIPKFEAENNYNLTETIKAMGITGMFQNNSDFNAMYVNEKGKCITDIMQKTKIIVNEKGTEAASGTVLATMGVDMTVPPVFQADRPFTYIITRNMENGQKEVLFIGQYVTAQQK